MALWSFEFTLYVHTSECLLTGEWHYLKGLKSLEGVALLEAHPLGVALRIQKSKCPSFVSFSLPMN